MYFILKPWVSPGSPIYSKSLDKRYNKYYETYTLLLSTKFNDDLNINDFRNKFYSNIDNKSIKIIPTDIASFLTPVALAYWIKDDGHTQNKGIFLNTPSFNNEEIQLLINALENNFSIKARPVLLSGNSIQSRIFIPAKYNTLIVNIVKPYFTPSMYYKLSIKN